MALTIEQKRKKALYEKETRSMRRDLGICTACGKEDAFKPYVLCPACLEKMVEKSARARKSWLEHPEKKARVLETVRKSGRKLYNGRKEAGLCPKCGKRKPAPGRIRCELCMEKDRNNSARYRDNRKYKSYNKNEPKDDLKLVTNQ